MRSISWLIILSSVLCSRFAFAADMVTVNIPFSFEAHGKIFPASQYNVVLKTDRSFLTLTSKTNPADTVSFTPFSADRGPNDPLLSIRFDQAGSTHELRSVRFGDYQTPVLDSHSAHLRSREAGQSGQ
jgi:hypothetical protein